MRTEFTIEHGGVEHHYELTIRTARSNDNPFASLEAAAREKKVKDSGLKNLYTIVISPGGMADKETDETLTYLREIQGSFKGNYARRRLG